MSLHRSLLLAAAATMFSMLAACSQSGASDTDSAGSAIEGEEDNLNNLTLEQATLLLGRVEQGGSVTVAYEPSQHYLTGSATKPFLGVELLPQAAEARVAAPQQLSISVAGNFPGTPRVLVTDASFNVLAGSRAANVQQDGDHVTVTIPASAERRFVLVRDGRWVEPMHFDIEAAPL